MARYEMTKQHKVGLKVISFLYLKDAGIFLAAFVFFVATAEMVHTEVQIAYQIIGMLLTLYLLIPASGNPGKRNYQAFMFSINRNKMAYHPIDSNKLHNEEMFELVERVEILEESVIPVAVSQPRISRVQNAHEEMIEHLESEDDAYFEGIENEYFT